MFESPKNLIDDIKLQKFCLWLMGLSKEEFDKFTTFNWQVSEMKELNNIVDKEDLDEVIIKITQKHKDVANWITKVNDAVSSGEAKQLEILLFNTPFILAKEIINTIMMHQNFSTQTILEVAVSNNDVAIVELLLKVGIKIDESSLALFHAKKNSNYQLIQILKQYGAVDNSRSERLSSLHFAARYGRWKLAKFLLENTSVDQDSRDDEGNTALMVAKINGHVKTAQVIKAHAHPGLKLKLFSPVPTLDLNGYDAMFDDQMAVAKELSLMRPPAEENAMDLSNLSFVDTSLTNYEPTFEEQMAIAKECSLEQLPANGNSVGLSNLSFIDALLPNYEPTFGEQMAIAKELSLEQLPIEKKDISTFEPQREDALPISDQLKNIIRDKFPKSNFNWASLFPSELPNLKKRQRNLETTVGSQNKEATAIKEPLVKKFRLESNTESVDGAAALEKNFLKASGSEPQKSTISCTSLFASERLNAHKRQRSSETTVESQNHATAAEAPPVKKLKYESDTESEDETIKLAKALLKETEDELQEAEDLMKAVFMSLSPQ